jgi:hypothetical protein
VPAGASLIKQFFTVTSYEAGTVSVTAQSSNTSFIANPAVSPCQTGSDADCLASGNDYKIEFASPAHDADGATILVKAKNLTTNLTGTTSFTLRRDAVGAKNHPVIANLPNYAVQVDSNSHVATYTTMFAIGDLGNDNMEDIDEIDAGDFVEYSSNTTLLSNRHRCRVDAARRRLGDG